MRGRIVLARLAATCLVVAALVAAPLAAPLAAGDGAVSVPTEPITGVVLDADDRPVSGARICYLLAQREEHCTLTDREGEFTLQPHPIDRFRVAARGYLPQVLASRSPGAPIVLQETPVLMARLVDATTGDPVRGHVVVTYSTGETRGPFFANEAGVRVRRLLEPGTVRVVGTADGYRDAEPSEVTLHAGRESRVTIELEPDSR